MKNKKYDYLIVGSGLSGCVLANVLAENGKKILIVEKRSHIGGNVYDFSDAKTNIIVQMYGPHIFHTNSETVVNYVKRFGEWEDFKLRCGVCIDGLFTPSPFNFKTIDQFFPEKAESIKKEFIKEYPDKQTVTILELLGSKNTLLRDYANFLFEKDYSLYTAKQWGISPKEVDPNVLKRVPVRIDYNEQYFTDKYQIMPKKGFSFFVSKMIEHPNIDIILNTNAKQFIFFENNQVCSNIKGCENVVVVWTGAIDDLFDYKYGLLPYRSLDFVYKTIKGNKFQDYPVVAYPSEPDFTRITDYSQLPLQKCIDSVVAYEYPKQYSFESKTDPYYPINTESNQKLYQKYFDESTNYSNLLLLGRLANYRYLNMDQIILEAICLGKKILNIN